MIEFKPRAIKDLQAIRREDVDRIVRAIEALQEGLVGDVKKLTNAEEYRALELTACFLQSIPVRSLSIESAIAAMPTGRREGT